MTKLSRPASMTSELANGQIANLQIYQVKNKHGSEAYIIARTTQEAVWLACNDGFVRDAENLAMTHYSDPILMRFRKKDKLHKNLLRELSLGRHAMFSVNPGSSDLFKRY